LPPPATPPPSPLSLHDALPILARLLGARRVRHQEKHALRRDRREACEVGLAAVDGGVVELPVTRVHDGPVGSLDGDADRIGDAVADVVRVAAEAADGERPTGLDLAEGRALRELVLLQFRA